MRDTPLFQLRRELLRRNFEKVSPWFGVIEPEHVRDRSNHEHLEGDRIVFAKLGFDQGVGHSLLLLYDAKTSHGKNVNYFNCLGYDYSITSISLF